MSRENLFIHYEPRWPTATPARYAFDRRWKLYESGGFYDMRTDPLEQRALNVEGLSAEGAVAYRALSQRIEIMPGELRSNHRWLPTQFYYVVGVALVVLAALVWLVWRASRYLRQARRYARRLPE